MEAAVAPPPQDEGGSIAADQSAEAPGEPVYQTVKFIISADDAQSLSNALNPGAVDALNLPSDAPLVVIQQDEDEDDDDDDDGVSDNYPADPKLRKTHARKVKFGMKCEWISCQEKGRLHTDEGPTFKCNELITHVKTHLLEVRDNIQKLLLGDDELINGQTDEENPLFKCLWEDCDFVPVRPGPTNSDAKPIDAQFEELTRHVFFHVFHSKLKYLGKVVSEKNRMEQCQFSSDSRNLIPELPDRMRCDWMGCDFAFDNPISFYAHVAKHVDDLPALSSSIRCLWGDCSKIIKRRCHMKEHMRVHTQEKSVGCPRCGGLFANKTKFSDHIVRQQSEADQIFHCQYCSKKFGLERLLRDHMRQHVNHYKCPLCDMTCAFPANLRHHIQYKHSEYRPHCCPRCPYMAKTQYDLTKHMNNHELEETYECDVEGCDYSSVSLECYKSHQRQHDLREAGIAKRRFQCHVCLKEFTRGTNLTSHLKNNHNVKWPDGLKRFKYVLYEDGVYRLQAVRYESIELTQQLMQSQQSELSAAATATIPEDHSTGEVTSSPSAVDSSTTIFRDENENSERSSSSLPRDLDASNFRGLAADASGTATATASGTETSGNENLEMLGDVASLLQTPTKKSLPQRKTRGKRKRVDDETTSPAKNSPAKKNKRFAMNGDLDVVCGGGGGVSTEDGADDEEDDGILYKLVNADDVVESPFALAAASSVVSGGTLYLAAADTPFTTLSSIPSSIGGEEEAAPNSSVGPASMESDATRYQLVSGGVPSVASLPSVASVDTNEDSPLLYKLTDGGLTSVGSSAATDPPSVAGEDDVDDDEYDNVEPPSSVAEVAAVENPPSSSSGATFQRLTAVVDSPGFLSSPEETILFRLADSIELPDELAVDSPQAVVHRTQPSVSSTATTSTDVEARRDPGQNQNGSPSQMTAADQPKSNEKNNREDLRRLEKPEDVPFP